MLRTADSEAVVMDPQEVKNRVDDALRELATNDHHLFETDVNERAIAARLAMYLQRRFPEYSVDTDYNREGHRPKRLKLPLKCAGYRNEDDRSLAVPDVIVHQRGPAGPNLVVLELKKTTNPDKGHCDSLRLRAFREQIGYHNGALIICETRKGHEPKVETHWIQG